MDSELQLEGNCELLLATWEKGIMGTEKCDLVFDHRPTFHQ